VQKPVIYRAAWRLEHLGLITVSEKQPSRRGAALAQLQATPAGRQAAGRWLREPVSHPRDIRSELLVKLALLGRAGVYSRDLLLTQRGQLAPVASALASQICTATGYDRVLAVWRHESVSATLRFLDALLATVPA
jgi:DNA-binding PadR family transcriptional regulator